MAVISFFEPLRLNHDYTYRPHTVTTCIFAGRSWMIKERKPIYAPLTPCGCTDFIGYEAIYQNDEMTQDEVDEYMRQYRERTHQ